MEDKEPYKLPDGWKWVKLGEVVKINPTKYKPEISDDEICSFIPMKGILDKGRGIYEIEERAYGEVKSGYTSFLEEDILFAKITPCMENEKITIAKGLKNGFGFGTTEFHVLRVNEKANNKYVMRFIRTVKFMQEAAQNMTGSVGQKRVPKDFIENYKFPLPPLEEQQRIANILDNLTSKLTEAKELINEARETFEKRRMAILHKAFTGELTKAWRAENRELLKKEDYADIEEVGESERPYELPDGWKWVRLGDCIKFYGGGTPSKAVTEYWENGNISWASVKDIKGKYLEITEDKITESGLKNSSAVLADFGDLILITRMSPGKIIISKIKTAINQDLKILKAKHEKIDKDFIYFYFEKERRHIEEISKGTTVKGITIDNLNLLLYPLPPLAEQKEIVRILENLLSKEEEAKALTDLEEQIELMEKSILSKAFRGEL